MAKQLSFAKTGGWGGKRQGAGRPNESGEVSHGKRDKVEAKYPMHITLRLMKGFGSLRSAKMFREFKTSLLAAQKYGLAVNHFALQGNQIHLILEAKSNASLSRGMKSFGARFGKAIRKRLSKELNGPVFVGRFHQHTLKSPREMKNAIKYVLLNQSKHSKIFARIDEFSSGYSFRHWSKLVDETWSLDSQLDSHFDSDIDGDSHFSADYLTEPQSWLGREGWMRARDSSE